VTTTPSVTFNGSDSVIDGEGGSATTRNNASLGSSSIQQFDSSLGVLRGATLNLTSTRTQTVTVSANPGNAANNRSTTTIGAGESAAKVSALGVELAAPSIAASGQCQGNLRSGCSPAATMAQPTPTNLSGAVDVDSLNSYIGSGSVTATRTADLSATQGAGTFPGAESTTYDLAWAGSLSLTYEYLLHAAPTFDNGALVLDLDFGTFFQGANVTPLGFGILNAAGERVGLDLDGVAGSGSLSQLHADLAGFGGTVDAGSGKGFLAYFSTANLGSFGSSYTFSLSDADVGADNSRSGYTMTLNLAGKVVAQQPRVNDVPEPGMLALASVGLLGLLLTRRSARRA